MLKFSQRYEWLFRLTAPLLHRKLMNDIRIMHDFTDKVIRERRSALERAIADGSYRPLSKLSLVRKYLHSNYIFILKPRSGG